MASTSSSSPPDEVAETYSQRRTKRARIDDGSCSAAEPAMPAPTGHSSWRDWSSLACGPATLIAERLLSGDVADYVRFRAACSAWRRCTADPHDDALDRRFHPRRWTMLNDIRRRGGRPYFRFMNISTGKSIQTAVRGVELGGRTFLARTSQELVVLLNRKTGAVCVVNPITGAHADLPPVTSLLSGRRHPLELLCPIWPDDPHFSAALTGDSAVVITFGWQDLLGVARPGDEHWAKVKSQDWIRGLFSSAGRVYCSSDDTLMVLKTSPGQPPELVKAFPALT